MTLQELAEELEACTMVSPTTPVLLRSADGWLTPASFTLDDDRLIMSTERFDG